MHADFCKQDEFNRANTVTQIDQKGYTNIWVILKIAMNVSFKGFVTLPMNIVKANYQFAGEASLCNKILVMCKK